tara:strand:+ start:645 stop:971 length:327 start_codon:yes stop_codon:yes gene_type:complete
MNTPISLSPGKHRIVPSFQQKLEAEYSVLLEKVEGIQNFNGFKTFREFLNLAFQQPDLYSKISTQIYYMNLYSGFPKFSDFYNYIQLTYEFAYPNIPLDPLNILPLLP